MNIDAAKLRGILHEWLPDHLSLQDATERIDQLLEQVRVAEDAPGTFEDVTEEEVRRARGLA